MDSEHEPSTSGYSEESGRGCRLKKKQINPIVCPVCGVTLRASEVGMHLTTEVERLNKIPLVKHRTNGRSTPNGKSVPCTSFSNAVAPKAASSADKNKNWETYQKIRSNRQSRQKVKARKRKHDEAFCPICNKDISTLNEDIIVHVEMCLRKSESSEDVDDNNETIDVEAFEEYEWAGQSRVRATSMLSCGVSTLGSSLSMTEDDEDLNVEDLDDSQKYGEPQYSECDVILPCHDGDNSALRKAVIGMNPKTVNTVQEAAPEVTTSLHESPLGSDPIVEVLKSRIKDLESHDKSKDNFKCLICMDRYRTPVISVCCWHVHCEQCWLQTLGAKKLCPQCNMITSPSDLRKIYM